MKTANDTSVVIRDVATIAEIRLVETLQKEVWGIPDIEVVPLSQLVAAKHAGGVLLGAFDGEALVGFAYGFAARENGEIAHHSHMVGVRREYRGNDLGFRLKAAERERVLGQGIQLMSWTFDPLQAMNAHFNFAKLGAISNRYFVDFYGSDAQSFLHQNGTDRLWVTWRLTDDRVVERLEKRVAIREPIVLERLIEVGQNGKPIVHNIDDLSSSGRLSIEVPTEIASIEKLGGELAGAWRMATRNAFLAAFSTGYFVEDFFRGDRAGVYVLTRNDVSVVN